MLVNETLFPSPDPEILYTVLTLSMAFVQLQRVSLIKDIGIYYSCTFSFSHHIDVRTGRTLKVLGFIKRNTKIFKSANCLRSLYFAFVRSILEYGAVV